VPTFTFPILFAIEEAMIIEMAAIMLVVKKRDPSLPSSRPNFS
jgi:hypothetical protein